MKTENLLKQIDKHKTKILETEMLRKKEETEYRLFLINNVTMLMDNVKNLIQVANACIDSNIDIESFFVKTIENDAFGFTKQYQSGPVLSLSAYFMDNDTLNWYFVRGNEPDPFLNDTNACLIHFLEYLPVFEEDFYQHLEHVLKKYNETEFESEIEC